MRVTLALVALFALSVMPAAVLAQEEIVVADFNTGEKPNNLGGDFGTWDKDPNDPTMYIRMTFVGDDAVEVAGYSARLDYDIDSPNPAYNGFWMKLEGLNAEPYKTLNIYVKGDREAGYTKQMKLELKNASGEVGKYLLTGITDEWQEFSVPLERFSGLKDKSNLTEFVIVFDDINATKKIGTIYFDEVTFSE